jgi:hypothetical protein
MKRSAKTTVSREEGPFLKRYAPFPKTLQNMFPILPLSSPERIKGNYKEEHTAHGAGKKIHPILNQYFI